ncbi:prepilin-type N-terminal cleavage/methylation domain-containing protein [Desulfococcaceae bacterium HSG8]|nr:prepilin-type N-terminal cleavage/methylation domain-containing protein [Desulfococcaceae bacterium HSG8]
MKNTKKTLKSQEGFTLIEIIAVLVILGILAAVAVPKFMTLTRQSKQKAVDGALSAGLSTVSMQYARLSLANDGEPTMSDLAAACGSIAGDFSFTFTSGSGIITVKAQSKGAADSEFSSEKIWEKPQ